MPEAVLHPLPLAFVDVAHTGIRRNGGPGNQQVAQFRQREHAEQQWRQRQAVPQIEAVESPAQRSRLRVGSDHRNQDAETARGHSAQRRVAGQDRNHRDAEDREGQQFRRSQEQHHRAQDRDRDRHQECAEHAAHQRRHIGGAQRASGLALLGHREAVEHGRRRCGAARHAKQDRWDRIAGRRGGAETEQEREGRVRVHVEGERQQHRRSGETADARNDAEHQAHHAAGAQIHQAYRIHQDDKSPARRGGHEGKFANEAIHVSPIPNVDRLRCPGLGNCARPTRAFE